MIPQRTGQRSHDCLNVGHGMGGQDTPIEIVSSVRQIIPRRHVLYRAGYTACWFVWTAVQETCFPQNITNSIGNHIPVLILIRSQVAGLLSRSLELY